jgi:hypothetical protein
MVTQQCKQSRTIAEQGYKLCIQLTNLNLNHYKMVDAMGLKLLHQGPLEWHHLPTKFHENLPISSKVISWGQRDRLVI